MLRPDWAPKRTAPPKSAPSRAAPPPPLPPVGPSSSSSISTPSWPHGADFVLEVRDDRQRNIRCNSSVTSVNTNSGCITRFGLCFERGSRRYLAGETIHGHVAMTLGGSILLRRIRVDIEGRTKLLQVSPDAPEGSDEMRKDRERFFQASCIPFGSDLDYAFHTTDNNFVLRAGDYEFFFQLTLDQDALPTVDASPAFIIFYECSAQVEYGRQSERLISCNCTLTVSRSIDLGNLSDRLQPLHLSKTVRLSDVIPDQLIGVSEDGHIEVELGVSSGVLLGNLPLRFSGHIVNGTGLPVTSVTTAIIQRVALRLPSKGRCRSSSTSSSVSSFDDIECSEWTEVRVVSCDLGSVDIGSMLPIDDVVLKLPADYVILPALRDVRRSFRCGYSIRLQISCQATRQLHMVSFDLPVSLGHTVSGSAPLSPTIQDDVF